MLRPPPSRNSNASLSPEWRRPCCSSSVKWSIVGDLASIPTTPPRKWPDGPSSCRDNSTAGLVGAATEMLSAALGRPPPQARKIAGPREGGASIDDDQSGRHRRTRLTLFPLNPPEWRSSHHPCAHRREPSARPGGATGPAPRADGADAQTCLPDRPCTIKSEGDRAARFLSSVRSAADPPTPSKSGWSEAIGPPGLGSLDHLSQSSSAPSAA